MRAFPNELAPTRVPIVIPAEKLAHVVDFWIAYLGLTGWSHRIQLVTAREFDNLNQMGGASWDLATSHFNVALRDPDDVVEDESYDMEQVLVHELLHVRLAAWTDESFPPGKRHGILFETCVEQPVDRVAMVLTTLGREHPSHPLKPKRKKRRS